MAKAASAAVRMSLDLLQLEGSDEDRDGEDDEDAEDDDLNNHPQDGEVISFLLTRKLIVF